MGKLYLDRDNDGVFHMKKEGHARAMCGEALLGLELPISRWWNKNFARSNVLCLRCEEQHIERKNTPDYSHVMVEHSNVKLT